MTATELPDGDRVWTVPNALSVLRLLGVPLFLWLALGPQADGWAVVVLGLGGATDYLDGQIARRYNQTSRIGALLDPAVDRLYILATLVALTARGIVPLWLTLLLVGRDLVLAIALIGLRRRGIGPPEVTYLGKAATLSLLYAFPLLFLGSHAGTAALVARVVGWAFAIWGTALYWWAAVLYLEQTRRLARAAQSQPGGDGDAGHDPGPASVK